ICADAHLDLMREIDAVDPFEEAVDEMLSRLLTLGDDVDAGIFLQFDREHGGIALGGGERVAGKLPRRPQHVRLGEPFGLRQRACDGGWKQHFPGSLADVASLYRLTRSLSCGGCERR